MIWFNPLDNYFLSTIHDDLRKRQEMINQESVESFLREVDNEFPIPLSSKVNISDLADKYCKKATLCCHFRDKKIIAMVAGYTENTKDQMGYISLVATTTDARRKGYSSALLMEFLEIARNKGLQAVHVYTHRTNLRAIGMYRKVGFVDYCPDDEPCPDDHHFIYYLE